SEHHLVRSPALDREKRERRRGGRRGDGDGARREHAAPARTTRAPRQLGVEVRAQEAIDAAEQKELPLAGWTGADGGEQGGVGSVLKQVRQPCPRFFVRHGDSSPSRLASRFRPRLLQLLTDPSGTCKRLAIAASLRSR